MLARHDWDPAQRHVAVAEVVQGHDVLKDMHDAAQRKRKTEVQREESNDSKSGWERAEPKEGFSLDKPKVRAQVESTKLREILNKIGTDEDSPF